MTRHVYAAMGWTCVGLGVIGAFLPVMPTTVFLILAAFLFGRSSPRARAWLIGHPVFGDVILRWEQTGGIPRRAKIASVGAMALTFGFSLLIGVRGWMLAVEAVALLSAALFILTRPD